MVQAFSFVAARRVPMVKAKPYFFRPFYNFNSQNPSFQKWRSQLVDVLGLHGGGGSTGMLKRLWTPDSQLRSSYLRLCGEQSLKRYCSLAQNWWGKILLICLMLLACKNDFWTPKTTNNHLCLAKQRPDLDLSWKVSMESSLGLAGNLKQPGLVAKTSGKRKFMKIWGGAVWAIIQYVYSMCILGACLPCASLILHQQRKVPKPRSAPSLSPPLWMLHYSIHHHGA